MSCDISPSGFHAAVYDGSNSYYLEPVEASMPDQLQIFYGKNSLLPKTKCHFQDKGTKHKHDLFDPLGTEMANVKAPNMKRTYRLALVAGGEFSGQFGGSPFSETDVLNALASGVNTINPIYLRDLGIEFILVSTEDLVFQNAASDPFDPVDQFAMIGECHNQCNLAIGNGAYDVGHLVLWSNTGGLASYAAVCQNGYKGEGFSGSSSSNKVLWVDYVCHELGHQFASDHNFAADCLGNSVDNFRFEPGEGSSIMSYANVCGSSNQYRSSSDPFFHYASIAQIQYYLGFTSCAQTAFGNFSDPVVDAKSDITIPKETPFILVGNASDGNDAASTLTYNWEQYEGNGPIASGSPDCNSNDSPLFRYRVPVSESYRHFPAYLQVLNGNNNGATWEQLPCSSGDMLFSMAVRDNNPNFGRVAHQTMSVTVANTGPFDVTAPNGGESYADNTTVTWTVNGTNSHCPLVDVLLSFDGGNSFTVIADGVANDGSENIDFPMVSTAARVLVRCDVDGDFRSGSTFYDTSDGNFSITQVAAAGNRVHPTVFLEGAYQGGSTMSSNLMSQIPLSQPYSVAPYNYVGTESLTVLPADMVDWVLLEIRSGTPNSFGARNTSTVETQAAILLKDGTVVDVEGDPVVFQNLNSGSAYRLCVRHRNHLDVLSAVSLNATANMYFDFTAQAAQAFGQEQLKINPDGTAMMHAGDFNQDAVIQNTDFDEWQSEPAAINVYEEQDANLDGVIQTTDFDLWNLNKAKIGHPELDF